MCLYSCYEIDGASALSVDLGVYSPHFVVRPAFEQLAGLGVVLAVLEAAFAVASSVAAVAAEGWRNSPVSLLPAVAAGVVGSAASTEAFAAVTSAPDVEVLQYSGQQLHSALDFVGTAAAMLGTAACTKLAVAASWKTGG